MRTRQSFVSRSLYVSPTAGLVIAAVVATLAASVPAQRQFEDLRKRGLPADGDATVAVALGDVDGDDDLDVVFGNAGQNRLYLNDGTGIYTDATVLRMPVDFDQAQSVALGDVDGDGDLDAVFGNTRQNRLYLNDGGGGYTDATALRMPVDSDRTQAVALGDIDDDGDLDMVAGNSAGMQNRLLLNDGGTYTDVTAARLPVDSASTQAVALCDVDGDGDLDMVLANAGTRSRLYLNDGAGTYTDATALRMPVDSEGTFAMSLGDVDDDGDIDMVFANSPTLFGPNNRLYVNNGTGTFVDATVGRLPADGEDIRAVALGDVDADGELDIVFGRGSGQQNRILLNRGGGAFTDATALLLPSDRAGTEAVALGDVDGDGDIDMVCGNVGAPGQNQNRLYLNDGSGALIDATAARVPTNDDFTRAVALGDVDGDEDLDLILANDFELQNRLYLNDGSGSYTDATALRMPVDSDRTQAVALGDVDGDGDLDMVLGNSVLGGGMNRLYLNDGSGGYTDATAQRMPVDGENSSAVALGDVDGDGDLDLVLGNRSFPRAQNRLYLNDGNGSYTDATGQRMPVDSDLTDAVALGDVDGDGDLDMVLGNDANQQNRLYLNVGGGSYTDATALLLPTDGDSTRSVALGDLDGDGDLDIVCGNIRNFVFPPDPFADHGGQNRLYLNDGNGTYTDATALRMPVHSDTTDALALGDVDEDGDLDLVLGNHEQNRLYLNDGSGTFADATTARMPVGPGVTVALGDVDGDGDFDMVFGSRQKRLYVNLLRQLNTPFLVFPGREFRMEAYARYGPPRAGDIVLAVISTARSRTSLPPFGTIGIDLSRAAGLPAFFVPQPDGVGSVSFTVPDQPGLIGVSVYAQALLLPFGGPWTLTNVTADVIVR